MTTKARKKMQSRMKRVFRQAVQARKKHQRLTSMYRKLQRKYRAA
ncbi:MAG TPA: hypothetical protein VGR38_10455 [Candidatus Polarisedimenticolia bacterium]|jgi:hypothetical protein|nr:hypothetical protein [Candidatus Polarisedimenticolia bacterium]